LRRLAGYQGEFILWHKRERSRRGKVAREGRDLVGRREKREGRDKVRGARGARVRMRFFNVCAKA